MSNPTTPVNEKELLLKKLKALWSDRRTKGKRLSIAASAMLAACYMFLFFGPFEITAFSGGSLVFGYGEVLKNLLPCAVIVFAAGTALLMLLRGKIFNYAVSAVFGLTLCGYLQSTFMNGTLGLLTGDAIDWSMYASSMLANLLIWLGVVLTVLFVLYMHRDFWSKLVTYVSLLLVVMQLAPTVAILAGAYGETKTASIRNLALSEEGFYEFSAEDNVFVFVLDRLDYDYIQLVLEEDPAFFDRLDGFTSYENAISAFGRTQPALAHMLTGQDEIAYRVSKTEYFNDIWTTDGGNILQLLKDEGYTSEIYTNIQYLFRDVDFVMEHVANVNNDMGEIIPTTLVKKLLELSLYRYAPIALKPFFWASTDYYNQGVYVPAGNANYQFNDAGYAPGFADSTADRTEKNFKFYHFTGPHPPHTLNADGTPSGTFTTVEEQTMGIFTILYSVFDTMKELGIYEDASIIITADHGYGYEEYDRKPVEKATRIGLFYKPSGSAGTSLQHSAAPVCTGNIPATILKSAGADYSAFGRALDEIGEDEILTRTYYKSIEDPKTFKEVEVYKYHVTGDAADFSNWEIVETFDTEYSFY